VLSPLSTALAKIDDHENRDIGPEHSAPTRWAISMAGQRPELEMLLQQLGDGSHGKTTIRHGRPRKLR
jgi:hypothetical protein